MRNKKLYKILEKVKNMQVKISELTDEQLAAKTSEFKERLAGGESTFDIMPEAFAVVCEADRRVLGMSPFDCQILGGAALHLGYLAEMNTGEGKTLTATMPLYLNALTGKSTMLVTANEYLAVRDAQEMRPVYEFLGLTVKAGVCEDPGVRLTNAQKKEIYAADIVYTTHGILGFDYLLNNLVTDAGDRFLREFNYVIIDEADMVLMDAATMPLVISGSPRVQSNLYEMADFFVTTLVGDRDFEAEDQSVWLTDAGVSYAEKFFGITGYYNPENFEINRHVTLALRAHVLMEEGKDYVKTEKNEISLLDGGTGRALPGMKLRGGLHQAIETKEHLEITQETRSVASITYQNLFLCFPHMAGMSGTISDASDELKKIYKKKVAVIPPNRPVIREDKEDLYFTDATAQYDAAIAEILRCHEKGRPVLAVTQTIADTELVSKLLMAKKVPHNVLNANNTYWEAMIIKEAGQMGAVTVSTGIAGRGTDIRLGPGVHELGGLAVIGVGRMSNIRLERQVRGRAGRQGDPGSSRFFVSLEDETVSSIGEKRIEKYTEAGKTVSQRKLRRLINGSQKLQEELAVSQRKQAVDYDKVLKRQRGIMYDARNRLLDGVTSGSEKVLVLARQQAAAFAESVRNPSEGQISHFILNNISYTFNKDSFSESISRKKLKQSLMKTVDEAWEKKKREFDSEEELDEYIRLCTLHCLDSAWVEQVDYLQQLQYAVIGRSAAQRNPVFEYQKESYDSFREMEESIRRDMVRNIFLGEKSTGTDGKLSIIFP